jgi:hypothetical protein
MIASLTAAGVIVLLLLFFLRERSKYRKFLAQKEAVASAIPKLADFATRSYTKRHGRLPESAPQLARLVAQQK